MKSVFLETLSLKMDSDELYEHALNCHKSPLAVKMYREVFLPAIYDYWIKTGDRYLNHRDTLKQLYVYTKQDMSESDIQVLDSMIWGAGFNGDRLSIESSPGKGTLIKGDTSLMSLG